MAANLEAGRPGRSSIRVLLTEPNFTFYFAATTISALGTSVAQLGLSLALLATSYTAATVGLVLAAQTIPTLILTLAGGVVGDRWSRRALMVASDLLRFASQAVLAILLALGHPSLPILMALAACVGIGNAFYRPAAGGLVPQIVTAAHLKSANSLTSMSASVSLILGAAIAGLLVGLGGGVLTIAADALSYLASATLLTLVKFPPGKIPRPESSFLTDLKRGAAEFRAHRWLLWLTIQIAVVNALNLGSLFVIGPSLFTHVKSGAQDWGFVTSAVGIGAFLGGFIVLKFALPRPLRALQYSLAMMTAPLILLALHAAIPLLMLASAVMGVGMSVAGTLFMTTVQKTIALPLLSRVSAINSLIAMALIPAGYALSPAAAALLGPRLFLSTGAALVLLSAATLLLTREIRNFEAKA